MFRLQFPRLFALFFVCLIELSALSLGFSLLFGFFWGGSLAEKCRIK